VKTAEELLQEALVPVEEQPYEIPSHWKWVRLHYVSSREANSFVDGPFGSNLKSSEYTESGVRLVQLQNIGEGFWKDDNKKYISIDKADELSRCETLPGDIVIAKMASPLARATIVPSIDDRYIIVADCVRLRVNEFCDPDYIVFCINSPLIRNEAEKRGKGSTRLRINISESKQIPVPLPPLEEQKRIDDKSERMLDRINRSKQLIEEAKQTFELRRAAILEKAFSGELTKKWREENELTVSAFEHITNAHDNLVNGKDFSRSNLINKKVKHEITKHFSLQNKIDSDLPKGWIKTTFIHLCVLQRGFDLPVQERVEGQFPIVSAGGVIDYHNQYKVKGPGVVTGRSGTIGKVYYINSDYWALNTSLFVDYFNGNDEKYVFHFLSNFNFKPFSSSTAVPSLNRNNLIDVEVTIPPVAEQKEIVRKIESLLVNEEEILNQLDTTYSALESIKNSILSKAFKGEL